MLWGVAFSSCFVASLNARESDLDEGIRQHRMGTLVVQAEPGAEVRRRATAARILVRGGAGQPDV
jgi:hypothetical protein